MADAANLVMEGSHSEAIFDSLKLNPQLFINSVINGVNDVVDDAFEAFKQYASALLDVEGNDRSEDLCQAVLQVQCMLQGVLNKRLDVWEKYSLQHIFSVPDRLSFPNAISDSSASEMSSLDDLNNEEADCQLNSLREKLSKVGRDSARLDRELQLLESQSLISSGYLNSISEALSPLEQPPVHDMFEVMVKRASELRKEVETFKGRSKNENVVGQGIYSGDANICLFDRKGPSKRFEDLPELINVVKSNIMPLYH